MRLQTPQYAQTITDWTVLGDAGEGGVMRGVMERGGEEEGGMRRGGEEEGGMRRGGKEEVGG